MTSKTQIKEDVKRTELLFASSVVVKATFTIAYEARGSVANAYSNKYVHRYLIYSSYDITVALRYYDYLIW